MDLRFDMLERKIDECQKDHEERIRALEKQTMPRTIAELGAMLVAAIGLAVAWLKGNV